jgi:hypothetical protein
MTLTECFRVLQDNINADPKQVEEARARRRMFEAAFATVDDEVNDSVPVGSLARGSQIEPINDVDLLVEFNPGAHPSWGQPGESANDALERTRTLVNDLLGSEEKLRELFGPDAEGMRWVRHTRLQNHAVKCFLDDPEEDDAFTVDVVPALPREGRGFWIPERESRKWIETDPVYLVETVLERHGGYGEGQFVQLIRVVKRWSLDHDKVIKGLTIEVLALDYLKDEPRPKALARYFQSALEHIWEPILDPAGLCGQVQPDLDCSAAESVLREAADLSARAIAAADQGDETKAQCLWWKLLGDVFPEPDGGCDKHLGAAAGSTFGIVTNGGRTVQDVEEG